MRRVEPIMGTAFTLDVRDGEVPAEAVEAAFASLHEADARFSPWKPDSEISRIQRGELTVDAASAEVREVADRCEVARRASHGSFDAWRHRPDGSFDPTGLVKGWAVERAVAILAQAGARNLFLAGGGDIAVRGDGPAGRGWRVGIQHPQVNDRIAVALALRDAAVATSGAYERGDHVVDPLTRRPPTDLLSVTIVGPSLTEADAFATAAFAMGLPAIAWIETIPDYVAMAITADERLVWSEDFEPYFEQAERAEAAMHADRGERTGRVEHATPTGGRGFSRPASARPEPGRSLRPDVPPRRARG
jgi:thiamine biosynthesis lipoprotein